MPPLLTDQRSHTFRRVTVIPAAAGLLALAAGLTACTGSSAPAKPAATASGIAATAVRVTGAGSTFDAPFFNLAFPAYQQSHPCVTVSYAPVGSSAGITRFAAGQAGFGATDVPASAADLADARGGPAVQVPVDLGGVTVAYNVLTRNGQPLKLTGPVLADIFLGKITRWDDPAITAVDGSAVTWPGGDTTRADAIILATGYRPALDYLAPLGALGPGGYPLHRGGVSTTCPSLAYVGLEWQRSLASASLRGVGRDARHIAGRLS